MKLQSMAVQGTREVQAMVQFNCTSCGNKLAVLDDRVDVPILSQSIGHQADPQCRLVGLVRLSAAKAGGRRQQSCRASDARRNSHELPPRDTLCHDRSFVDRGAIPVKSNRRYYSGVDREFKI